MATTTVTQPADFPQPKQVLRQGVIVTIMLVLGVGLGMLLDTGRASVSGEIPEATPSQVSNDPAQQPTSAASATDVNQALYEQGLLEIATWAVSSAQEDARLTEAQRMLRLNEIGPWAVSLAPTTADLSDPEINPVGGDGRFELNPHLKGRVQ